MEACVTEDVKAEFSGGAWMRVADPLGLKFSGFVDLGPRDRMVASVL